MGHPENYRWFNVGRVRININMATKVIEFKRRFVEDKTEVKIAPRISHTVYPK